MYWLWSAWLVLLIASFTGLESYAVVTRQPTLSRVAATAGAKCPPLLILYGAPCSFLAAFDSEPRTHES
jgi:hypothetical protein